MANHCPTRQFVCPPLTDEQLAITTDMLVDGVHFPTHTLPEAIAAKSLAANLSDLAAMGADPYCVHVDVVAGQRGRPWYEAIRHALERHAQQHQLAIRIVFRRTATRAAIIVVAVGRVATGGALLRRGAHPGDDLWVSGTIGDAGGALSLMATGSLQPEHDDHHWLLQRLDHPTPRLQLGRALRGIASSAIDLSDGLAGDAGHLCEQSGVAIRIDTRRLPLSRALQACFAPQRACELALGAGDDYELCFTAPPAHREAVHAAAHSSATAVTCVGRVISGHDLLVSDDGIHWRQPPAAYQHFRCPHE